MRPTCVVESYVMPIAWRELMRGFNDPHHKMSVLTNCSLPDVDQCVWLTGLTRFGTGVVRHQLCGVRCRLYGSYSYERQHFHTEVSFVGAMVAMPRPLEAGRFRDWYRAALPSH